MLNIKLNILGINDPRNTQFEIVLMSCVFIAIINVTKSNPSILLQEKCRVRKGNGLAVAFSYF
jgi:hypothetical protein